MTASKNIDHIPAVDHLRAFAAILVLFYHSVQLIWRKIHSASEREWPKTSNPFMSVIHEGHTGVALFIVLSGFIFTYGNYDKKIIYLQFLRNRILRIYPLMITMTTIGISVFPKQFTMDGLICILLPLQNTDRAPHLGSYSAVFWTIGVEFQFYLIFPFLNEILIKQGLIMFLPILGFTFIARLSAVFHDGNPQDFSYYTILGRLDQFIIGMVTAIILKRFSIENRHSRWGMPLSGVGLLSALFIFNRLGGWIIISPWKIVWPPIEGLLWGVFIATYLPFMHGKDNFLLRLFGSIGTISYSIYLTHMTVITLVVNHSLFFILPYDEYLSPLLSSLIIVFPMTMIVSCLCYHVVEKPFLTLRRSYVEKRVIKDALSDILADNPE